MITPTPSEPINIPIKIIDSDITEIPVMTEWGEVILIINNY